MDVDSGQFDRFLRVHRVKSCVLARELAVIDACAITQVELFAREG